MVFAEKYGKYCPEHSPWDSPNRKKSGDCGWRAIMEKKAYMSWVALSPVHMLLLANSTHCQGLSTDLSEKSSKTFCCPASPSARRTASWKSLNEYRTIAGGVSAPFDNMVRRSLVAARTSVSGWELTQRGSHHPRTVAVE